MCRVVGNSMIPSLAIGLTVGLSLLVVVVVIIIVVVVKRRRRSPR